MDDNGIPTLAALREGLDGIDAQMTKLFIRRMELVGEIAERKRLDGLPVRDAAREAAQLERAAALGGQRFEAETVRMMEQMLVISREYQSKQAKPPDNA